MKLALSCVVVRYCVSLRKMADSENYNLSTPTRFFHSVNSSEIAMRTPGSHSKSSLWENMRMSEEKKHTPKSCGKPESRRGRPGADMIQNLINEGTNSPSRIKCTYCARVFPRHKSLAAHIRTHTSVRPYKCDFPGCDKSFNQSGQMKTHQRLHTGEKPFQCMHPGCSIRFTHPNRQCTDHPYASVKRRETSPLTLQISESEKTKEVLAWFEKMKEKRMQKTPGRSKSKRELYAVTPDTPKEDKFMNVAKQVSSKRFLGHAFHEFDGQTPENLRHGEGQNDFLPHLRELNGRLFDTENYHGGFSLQRPIPASPKEHHVLQNTENTLPMKHLKIDLDGIKPLSETECSPFNSNRKTQDSFYSNYLQTKYETDAFGELMEEVINLPVIQAKRNISEIIDTPNHVSDIDKRFPKKRWVQIHRQNKNFAEANDEPLDLCLNRARSQ